MQELANHEQQKQRQQEDEAVAAAAVCNKEALILHGNLDFEQSAIGCGDLTPSSAVDSGRSSAGSLEDYTEHEQHDASNSQQVIFDAILITRTQTNTKFE